MMLVKKYQFELFPTAMFLKLTSKIYGKERSDKLPVHHENALNAYFLVENEEVLATATVYLNHKLVYEGSSALLIGNFEATEVDCALLFETIETDAKELGVHQMIGPMNGSTWGNHRFMLDAPKERFLSEMEHPAYYRIVWERAGFNVCNRYFSYRDKRIHAQAHRSERIENHFQRLGVKTRMISLVNFEMELKNIYRLCMEAFKNNVLYTEISEKQFIANYLPMKSWLKEEYIWLAEDEFGDCVGFLFAFENKLNTQENELIVKTIARHPSFKFNGLGTLLGNRFMEKAKEKGVTSIIHAFMHEQNVSKNLSQRFNGTSIRTYALLSKKLNK